MSFFSEAGGEVKNIPWWAWAGGAMALLFFGSHLLNKQNSAAATSADVASSGGIDSTGSVGDIGSPGPQLYDGTGLPPRSVNPGPQPYNGTGLPPTRVNGPAKGTTSGTGSPTAAQTYTVRGGDTLYDIASRYHVDENTLYSVNAGTIEATAKSHALASSDHGHWIFPGEILKIPA